MNITPEDHDDMDDLCDAMDAIIDLCPDGIFDPTWRAGFWQIVELRAADIAGRV